MKAQFKRILAWAARNERHLGAVFFTGGLITDLLTFTLLSVEAVNVAFLAYLVLATVAIVGSYAFAACRGEGTPLGKRTLAVGLPFLAQYAIGGVLSGCLIFYTKSSVLEVSWPFLVLLGGIYFGNEYFRKYKERLIFQATLLFFAYYAYAIFALPLAVGALGPWVFAGSSAASLVGFGAVVWLLRRINRARLEESLRRIVISVAAVVVLVNTAYFTGTIPPIPLTMPEAGVYHSVSRVAGGYALTGEESRPWWWIWEGKTVHHVPGTPLFAFSAVSAPVAFSTFVAHVWEREGADGRWREESRIVFPMSGGREGGYRGYSLKDDPLPGRWRVSIETPSGQVIGRLYFSVENVRTKPPLVTEVR